MNRDDIQYDKMSSARIKALYFPLSLEEIRKKKNIQVSSQYLSHHRCEENIFSEYKVANGEIIRHTVVYNGAVYVFIGHRH